MGVSPMLAQHQRPPFRMHRRHADATKALQLTHRGNRVSGCITAAVDKPNPKPKPRRSRRVRRIVIVALITAVALGLAEVAISRSLAWKLKETIADKLDAQLQIKSLWFVPPVGVYVSGATLS